MKMAMKCRGLLLTLSYTDFSSTSWQLVTLHVLKSLAIDTILAEMTLSRPLDLVVAHQPKIVLIDLIMQL